MTGATNGIMLNTITEENKLVKLTEENNLVALKDEIISLLQYADDMLLIRLFHMIGQIYTTEKQKKNFCPWI